MITASVTRATSSIEVPSASSRRAFTRESRGTNKNKLAEKIDPEHIMAAKEVQQLLIHLRTNVTVDLIARDSQFLLRIVIPTGLKIDQHFIRTLTQALETRTRLKVIAQNNGELEGCKLVAKISAKEIIHPDSTGCQAFEDNRQVLSPNARITQINSAIEHDIAVIHEAQAKLISIFKNAPRLKDTDITAENLTHHCKQRFFDMCAAPKRSTYILSNRHFEQLRDLRLLGFYFLPNAANNRKILIEVKREQKKEISIDFPKSVNPFQRKSTKNLIERLAPGFDVHLRRTPATEPAMPARKPRKVRPPKELDVDVDYGDKFDGTRDPFAEAARMTGLD